MIYLMHICGTSVINCSHEFAKRDAVLKEIAAGKHLSTLAFSERDCVATFGAGEPDEERLDYR